MGQTESQVVEKRKGMPRAAGAPGGCTGRWPASRCWLGSRASIRPELRAERHQPLLLIGGDAGRQRDTRSAAERVNHFNERLELAP